MKKILFIFTIVSNLLFANYKSIDLQNYVIKPNSIKKVSNTKYLFNFEIKYKSNQYGFNHDIKLMKGSQILESTVENIITQFYQNNKNAILELNVPKSYENFDFDGIAIIDSKTNFLVEQIKFE